MTDTVLVEVPTALWADLLAVAIPASAAVGLCCVVAWRRVPEGRRRRALQWAGVLLLFVVPLAAPVLWNSSTALVVHQRAVVAAWFLTLGGTIGVILVLQALSGRGWQGRPPSGATWGSMVFFVLAMTIGALVGADLLGDVTHPRTTVDGLVEDVRPGRSDAPRPPVVVVIGGEEYRAVGEGRVVLRPGMRVRADVLHRTRTLTNAAIAVPREQARRITEPARETGES